MLAALFGNTCSWPQTSGYYWQQSRRPLTCLAFVAPLLVLYEGGVLWLGPQAMRNGADVWLRQFLDLLGFGQYFLLPLLTVAILLGWHHTTAQKWQIVPGVLYTMFAECLLLGTGSGGHCAAARCAAFDVSDRPARLAGAGIDQLRRSVPAAN